MTNAGKSVNRVLILLSIFFISISLFVYQVTMTRLYSVVFSYHYVFLITSFAILGLGIGSIFAYKSRVKVLPGRSSPHRNVKAFQPQEPTSVAIQINKGSIILAFSYIVVFAISYLLPAAWGALVYIVLGTIPFIIGGYLFSILFTEYSEISGKLYFADLIGSGIGSLAVIFLLNSIGMFRSIAVICIIALIPAVILPASGTRIRAAGYILPVLLIASFLMPGQYVSSIEMNFKGLLNNTGKTFGKMEKSGMSPEIVFTEWNAFSRTDVIKLPKDPEEMILTIDGAANAPMYEFDGNIDSLGKFKGDTGFLPFTIGNSSKTLLIGPGGGRDVLYALAGGSTDITAVEINTSSIEAVKAMGEYNGNIYNRPEVKVYGDDGRSFVRKSEDKYDVIFLSLVMTNTSQGMAYALAENYIYTTEAMTDYLDHLSDNGKIAFLAHDEEDLSKIVATAIQALGKKGIPMKDTPQYIALFAKKMPTPNGAVHMHNPLIIIKNDPFTEEESKQLLETAQKGGSLPIYTPLVYEKGPLHHIKEAHISMADYLNGFDSNVTPATDDSPYFYNFGKTVPSILLAVLLIAALGGIILFGAFAVKEGNFKPTIYFSLLGVGFMMVEVPLIQKFILYLGHPALAFTYVLAALLIGGGIGGYLSNNKLFDRTIKFFYLPPAAAAIINIVLLLTLGFIFKSTADISLTGRIIIASVLMMLQGFFMGMPFPRGLKLIGESGRGEIVPVMWGVNGVTSVVGSVLSVILSMTIGFTGALIVGAVIYLIVSLYKTI